MSLDGFIADEQGNFDWAAPDEEVHRFVNELERPVGTLLYGRRMYETMVYWETGGDESDYTREFATIWRAAEKVVFSKTLDGTSSARTRIERSFDHELVKRLKASSSQDLTVGGPDLAGQALLAGLVDELQLFVTPVVVGSGKRALPLELKSRLRLRDERRFGNGTVFLRYEVDV
jgi:dihydrofolate reductase